MKRQKKSPPAWVLVVLIVATWAVLSALRISAPSDFMDNDQQRPAAYVMDILVNGDWIVQTDDTGDIMSKPPVHTWLIAICAVLLGGVSEFALMLPGAVSVLLCALLIFAFGNRYFGSRAAFLGAAMSLLSMTGMRQIGLIRSDAVFSLLTFACFLLLFLSLERKTSWIWFWIVASLATLTKGPLGLVLAAGGLIGYWFLAHEDRREDDDEEKSRRLQQHGIGLALFLLIAGGWFLAALWAEGQPVIDKMIGRELVAQAVNPEGKNTIAGTPHKPVLFLLSRFAPWSLFFVFAVYRIATEPAKRRGARVAEKALLAYSLFGLALFSLGAHQRPDHLLPLIPAVALLAGRELTRLIDLPFNLRGLFVYTGAAITTLVGFGIYYNAARPVDRDVIRSAYVSDFADHIKSRVGADSPFIYFAEENERYSLQFHLGTMHQRVTPAKVHAALRSNLPAFVVTRNAEGIQRVMAQSGVALHIVASWPNAEEAGSWPARYAHSRGHGDKSYLQIVSNRPVLERTDRFITFAGDVLIRANGMRFEGMTDDSLQLRRIRPEARVILKHEGKEPKRFRIVIDGVPYVKRLTAGETWALPS